MELSLCAKENNFLITKRQQYIPRFYIGYWRHDESNLRHWKMMANLETQARISDLRGITNLNSSEPGAKIVAVIRAGFLDMEKELLDIQRLVKTNDVFFIYVLQDTSLKNGAIIGAVLCQHFPITLPSIHNNIKRKHILTKQEGGCWISYLVISKDQFSGSKHGHGFCQELSRLWKDKDANKPNMQRPIAGCGFGKLLLYLAAEVLFVSDLPKVIYLQALDDKKLGAAEYYMKIGFTRVHPEKEGSSIDLPDSMQHALAINTIHFRSESKDETEKQQTQPFILFSLNLILVNDCWDYFFQDNTHDTKIPLTVEQGENALKAINLIDTPEGPNSYHDDRCKIDYIPLSARQMYEREETLYKAMVEATKNVPFFNINCFTSSYDAYSEVKLSSDQLYDHMPNASVPTKTLCEFVLEESVWLKGDIIELFIAWMLRDRLHPIHQNITILPGGEGFLAALFHYRNDETKFRTSVGKWLLDPSNIEKMKRPIIICPMNEHQSHWICLVLFNPLCCQQPQDEMFSGYIIYDSMGNNCFENDKSEHLLVLQKLLHMTHAKIYETDEQLDYLKELLDPNKFSPLFLESRTGHQNAPDSEQFNTVLKQNDTHSCGIMVILFVWKLC